jgi:hypothetical protein
LEISAGLFVPWMFVWQFRQPRASRFAAVLPPAVFCGPVKPAWLPRWLVGSWHCWHRNGGLSLSRLSLIEPCGLWQSAQFSCTGWCVRTNGPRFSMWHE